ncbi:glycosyltransferase [uncultured Polaribacter sp.]|uniref:glycosyltransferase n=1 Tax=uncultured Polaribacter sp. TaxID=174711 RepID=UPI00263400F5|nr:glycosyltransferase [uncultured Polaribacter sp.]
MKTKRVFILATIGSFIGLPPVKQLHNFLKDYGEITTIQNTFNDFTNFLKTANNRYTIHHYNSSKDFNNQSVILKVFKYLKLTFFLLFSIIKNSFKKKEIIIYSFDFFTIYLSVLFKTRKTKIIYHQFEIVEIEQINKIDAFLLSRIFKNFKKIDLAIFPEANRMQYFKNLLKIYEDYQFFILPNTNNNSGNIRIHKENKKVRVTHIGAVGANHHLLSYLKAIELLPKEEFEFWFVGMLDRDSLKLIKKKKLKNIILTGQIPHEQLADIYLKTDIGVVLYKDRGLNYKYCAPNKLYEYWSYGIPVLGDKLPGLASVFINKDLGLLVDMNVSEQISFAFEQLGLLSKEKSQQIKKLFDSTYHLDVFTNELKEKLKI